MGFQRSRIQSSKKIKIEDGVKQDDLEAACGDDFWKEAPEDVLLEIFIRLPDSRSAIRTANVCHNWHSVISQSPLFVSRFTILFRKADERWAFKPQHFQPICTLFSEEDTSPKFLDFVPCSSPMVIRGSCNDLLLVSPGSRGSTQLFICNPLTKQFIQLPEITRPDYGRHLEYDVVGHALVCMPGPTNKFRFKVVEFKNNHYLDSGNMVRHFMLFCSETRKWETRRFNYPRPTTPCWNKWLHGVACNGVLYWLESGYLEENRVIYLDLSNDQCGAIDFPKDSCHGTCFQRDQIGVVRVRGGEELRLLQVVLTTREESTVDLKVWKLSHKKKWVLVHHKNKLKKPNRSCFQALPFVHPTNGDVVFMVWGQRVFQHFLKDTNTKAYELICKLQEPLEKSYFSWEEPRDRLLQFPVVHTFWPTQILT